MHDDANPISQLSLWVNGEARTCARGSTVADLLRLLNLRAEHAAVERNKQLVRRADHASTTLQEGDRIEVVSFFGGG